MGIIYDLSKVSKEKRRELLYELYGSKISQKSEAPKPNTVAYPKQPNVG